MFCSLFGGQIYTENVCSPVTSVRLQILILRKPLCPVRTNHQHGMFELEELGQYNQRNSIVFHGLKENSAGVDNTTEAKMKYVPCLGKPCWAYFLVEFNCPVNSNGANHYIYCMRCITDVSLGHRNGLQIVRVVL